MNHHHHLERTRRRNIAQKGSSSSTERTTNIRITCMNIILNLVKCLLENSESEEQTDKNDHRNQTNAAHAHLGSAAHLGKSQAIPFSKLFFVFRFGLCSANFCSDLENRELGNA